MVTKFEETESLNVRSGRGRKPVSTEAIEKVAIQVEEDKASNVHASTSVRHVAEALDLPRAGGPVTCSITGQRYASLLLNKIIPDLQAHQCFSRIIFMQDGAPPHITRCVKDVLKHHFIEERVISRQIRHLWPPRSPDLNPCDFWLWGHLKQLVSRAQPRTLPYLKDSISRHVLNISQNTLRSTVEHAILRFQIVAENDGHHFEHL
ncbi:uncharacterized protein TNCV_5000041 [Trichonephila clavipes]|nr:uncharacterized protein TNCV_5000041 [Trichonephila clavipes]